jgi:serine protein kinase
MDFRQIAMEQQKEAPPVKWDGNLISYMEMVEKNPEIANFAPARIYNMIMKHGTSPMEESIKTKGYEDLVWYDFFKGKIFGNRTAEGIHDIMKFLKASARRTETGKRVLMLVGPVASAKSTIAALIKRGLEQDDVPKYAIKGCPVHEEPLHAIPHANRAMWEERLGVKIEGELCPFCQKKVDDEFTDEDSEPLFRVIRRVKTFLNLSEESICPRLPCMVKQMQGLISLMVSYRLQMVV